MTTGAARMQRIGRAGVNRFEHRMGRGACSCPVIWWRVDGFLAEMEMAIAFIMKLCWPICYLISLTHNDASFCSACESVKCSWLTMGVSWWVRTCPEYLILQVLFKRIPLTARRHELTKVLLQFLAIPANAKCESLHRENDYSNPQFSDSKEISIPLFLIHDGVQQTHFQIEI